MNNLDNFSLISVFDKLSLIDLINCSQVCRKWKKLINFDKNKYLFFCYGTKFFPYKTNCEHNCSQFEKSNYLEPNYIIDNSVLELEDFNLLKNIEIFIYHGNNYFDVPKSFTFKMLPKLNHLEIMDSCFNNFVYLELKDFYNSLKQYYSDFDVNSYNCLDPNDNFDRYSDSSDRSSWIESTSSNDDSNSSNNSFLTNNSKKTSNYKDILNLNSYSNLFHRIFWNYYSHSIETLIMKQIEFFLLVFGFPNVKYVKIDNLIYVIEFDKYSFKLPTTKWKSFYLKNESEYYPIFDFLVEKCPYLENVEMQFYSIRELPKMMCHLYLKRFCTTFNFVDRFFEIDFEDFEKLISDFEQKLNTEFNLCINNCSIKCLEDLKKLRKFFSLKENSKNKSFNFDLEENLLQISKYPILDFHKRIILNNYHFEVLHLNIDENERLEIYFEELMNILPKTIKKLKINSNKLFFLNTLNLLPVMLPYLTELNLDCPFIKLDNLNFISDFQYLNYLGLTVLEIDYNELRKTCENLNFFEIIVINSNKKSNLRIENLLKDVFMKDEKFSFYSTQTISYRFNYEYVVKKLKKK